MKKGKNETEETLGKAIKLKRKIEDARARENKLNQLANLCWGNTGDVNERVFRAEIHSDGRIHEAYIRPASLKLALDKELEMEKETLHFLENELDQLH